MDRQWIPFPKLVLRGLMLVFLCTVLPWGQSRLHAQQTLWEKRDPKKAMLFQSIKARDIGDSLTIVISENTDVQNSDRRGLNKSGSASAAGALSFNTSGGTAGSGDVDFSGNSDRKFAGDSSFQSAREFSDQFTVTVVDVLPNGNLLISGQRSVQVEGDKKLLSVSGIVRIWDIQDNNSIQSQHVSNLSIQFTGGGTEQHFTKQGWFSRQVNKLWPF